MPLVSDAKFTNVKIENLTGSNLMWINDEPLITCTGDGQFKLNITNISPPDNVPAGFAALQHKANLHRHNLLVKGNIDPSKAVPEMMPKGVVLINPLSQKKNTLV